MLIRSINMQIRSFTYGLLYSNVSNEDMKLFRQVFLKDLPENAMEFNEKPLVQAN